MFLARQLGRHEDQFCVHGKMHQATLFEGEQHLLGRAQSGTGTLHFPRFSAWPT